MTVFAIFTYTEFFKHKSAEGEKMDKKKALTFHCSVEATMAVLGGKYKAIIIWHLNVAGIMRYSEIQKAIPQALVITLGWIIAGVVSVIPVIGTIVGGILYIFMTVCSIMGLIYACQEQEKEVPLIGQIKILK